MMLLAHRQVIGRGLERPMMGVAHRSDIEPGLERGVEHPMVGVAHRWDPLQCHEQAWRAWRTMHR